MNKHSRQKDASKPRNRRAWRKAVQQPPPAAAAYTIDEFCGAMRISRSTYYFLRNNGTGPREFRVGTRVLITHQAAADWTQAQAATA